MQLLVDYNFKNTEKKNKGFYSFYKPNRFQLNHTYVYICTYIYCIHTAHIYA